MSFKLGSESRKIRNSSNTPIFRKKLEDGVVAEANMDGRAAYGENWVMWEGKIYFRKNGYIDGPNGRWPEGDGNHPWEQEAIEAENE